jgi:hypothetical protein
MLTGRKDELSLHMRIPADKSYLGNAILTLEGICDHFSVPELERTKISEALHEALHESINFSYSNSAGLFDLKFSVFKDKLQITVEDFMLNDNHEPHDLQEPVDEIQLRKLLSDVIVRTDDFRFLSDSGRHSCFLMQFNLLVAESTDEK